MDIPQDEIMQEIEKTRTTTPQEAETQQIQRKTMLERHQKFFFFLLFLTCTVNAAVFALLIL